MASVQVQAGDGAHVSREQHHTCTGLQVPAPEGGVMDENATVQELRFNHTHTLILYYWNTFIRTDFLIALLSSLM